MALIRSIYASCTCWLIILLTSCTSSTQAKPTNTGATAAAAAAAAISLKTSDLRSMWEHVNKTCLSRDCAEHVNTKHLHDMASQMNRAIDPCEDFHEYACSKWKQRHGQEHTMMAVGEKQLTHKYQQIFGEYKERPELRHDTVFLQLQHYYQVCRDSERAERASWQSYIETLRQMGYLQLNNETHWLKTLSELNLYSNTQFFISLHVDRINASRFMLNIDPHNVMERVNLTADIYQILSHYGYTNDSWQELKAKFQHLEMELENILNSSCVNKVQDENNECDLTEWLSWQELQQHNASSINWHLLVDPFHMKPSDVIAVYDIDSLEKIKGFLDGQHPSTLLSYAIARFVNHLKNHTHNIVAKGSSELSCLRHMRKMFPLSMNYIYEKIFYSAELRALSDAVIERVFGQLKQEFSLILDANHMHLSTDSIQYLRNKLSALQLNIGNLPKNVSSEFYVEFMADLTISSNFYVNHLNALRHYFKRLRMLASPDKVSVAWYSFNLHMPDFKDAMDSTAYYFCCANLIVLPFAYLQLPFYDHRFWPALLYGDLANTLGHELIHAFDSKFLFYDHGGNYNEQEPLQILNNPAFESNLACLNRKPTEFLSERIADISGTHLALRIFAKDPLFLKQNGKIFFLQFAQFFCGSLSKELFALADDSHDLDNLRLNYTLAHMPEFAEVFSCPVGSPMNPEEKCHLW